MKTYFEEPKMEIVRFSLVDILTASGGSPGNEGDGEELPPVRP